MIRITKEGVRTYQSISKMVNAGPHEVSIMNNFMTTFVDGNAHCCATCPSQIRFFWKRLKDWGNANQQTMDEVMNEPDPKLCECGNVINGTDKRIKKCDNCRK